MTETYEVINNVASDIFRAYDVRGEVGEKLNANVVYTLGLAIGSEIQDHGQHQVIIGRDGRISGPEFIQALRTGLLASGCDVTDIGCVPSPVLYYATHVLGPNSGVVLTGSHNPTNFNGLKIVVNGQTLSGQRIIDLRNRVRSNQFRQGQGEVKCYNIKPSYIERIASEIQLKRPLSIVIDCGNGITGAIAPQLFRALGCDVTTLYEDVNGHFPNHHPDPSVVENLEDLIKSVAEHKADIGLAFDGDGDRLGVVTNEGEVIFPDRQVMLFAREILKQHANAKIVYDIKCSRNVENIVKEYGGIPIMTQTGHSLLKAKMLEEDARFAGEMSGHFFFNDHWYGFDDGMYSGARLLETLANSELSSAELFKAIPNAMATPELKIDIDEKRKFSFLHKFVKTATFPGAKLITIDGLRVEFADGWGLLRCSNTTPTLIARFEADDEAALKRIQQDFKTNILKCDENLTLPF